jgi:hypothetical protein
MVGRGSGVRGLAAVAAVAGMALLFCGSALAKMPQTITFTSSPPTGAVAGESYEVAATETSGGSVDFWASGACSFEKPWPTVELYKKPLHEKRPPHINRSPAIAYLVGKGPCRIYASGEQDAEYEEATEDKFGHPGQEFAVAKDPSEHIRFLTAPPHDAVVGGSYNPSARSSADVEMSFSSATPSVCDFSRREPFRFLATGTCRIDVRQSGSSQHEAPEAQQSFKVSAMARKLKKGIINGANNCTEGEARKNGRCVKVSPAPETLSATLIVHVYVGGGPPGDGCTGPPQCPSESQDLRISRLGPEGEIVRSVETHQHTIRLAPGRYELTAWTGSRGSSPSTQVTLSEHQKLDATLVINAK